MSVTAQQKAKDLVGQFIPNMPYADTLQWAKKCAIICVDEIIGELKDCEEHTIDEPLINARISFWEQVKEEINKL